jgi:hypothetical protein
VNNVLKNIMAGDIAKFLATKTIFAALIYSD